MPKIDDVDRLGYLFARKFPGCDKADPAIGAICRKRHRSFDDPATLDEIYSISGEWDLRGCSLPPVKRSLSPAMRTKKEKIRLLAWMTESSTYYEFLNTCSDEEFIRIYTEARQEDEAKRLAKSAKEDFDRFFNEPSGAADFSFWLSVPGWTSQEAVALSLGKNPEIVNSSSLKAFKSTSPFAKEFFARLFVVDRALETEKLMAPLGPHGFQQFAKVQKWTMPEALLTLKLDEDVDWKSRYDEAVSTINELQSKLDALKLAEQEIEKIKHLRMQSWYRLALGLARAHYLKGSTAKRKYTDQEAKGEVRMELNINQIVLTLRYDRLCSLSHGPIKDMLVQAENYLINRLER